MTTVQLLIGALTLLTNAFFVGAEFALISVRRSQIEPAALKGNLRARSTLWGLQHLSAAMATAQLGITISSLVLGAVAEPAIAHLLEPPFEAIGVPEALIHPIAFVIALTAATYLHMLIGEMVPKNIALAAPAPTALLLGPPLVALTRGMRPVIFGINAFANAILRLMKVEPKDEVASVFTDDELARLVKDSSEAGLLDPADGERLRDALELGTRPAGEVMVPLNRSVTVGHDITPRQLERAAAASGFSRLPVIGPGDEVLGYLHIKDALGVAERDEPYPTGALHPMIRVEIDTPLDDTMTAMRAGGTHLAAVTGDRGTVIGFVTMEDVLGELVGPSPTV
ncbi:MULTISPECIES: hemolysin family protein [Streptomyces]|uniref:hemolysin family protein n=1 Tax=Streptomyces TaxID=1883 RepID=UPI000F556294|nr:MULTISPECIES: hemolysin family protein [Streptomyces]MDX3061804.1 hemolysin family protein [Streptomyces sp. ND04-05B]RPK72633.1 Magnesium and cobalt efflux protein CorC [Streptomyces sp. ADI97-07]WRY80500.1 hemolysin family protein [Streptomyces clavifer]WUC26278.1 hemolysin family protein [Streptomyces clavifer]